MYGYLKPKTKKPLPSQANYHAVAAVAKPKAPTPFQMVGRGLKAIGGAVVAPLKWAGNQVAKEMQADEAKDTAARATGKALNSSYSGRTYGYQTKKK